VAETPATPATPAAAPAAAAAQDPVIKLPDGSMQPLSRIVSGFQQYSAKEQEAMASAQKAQKLEAQLQAAMPNAQAYVNLQALIAKDPKGAEEQFGRIIRLATGVQDGGQANTGAATDDKIALRLQELDNRLNQMHATEMGRAHVAEIREAMKDIPVFANSPEARKLAETFVATMRANNPDMPVKQAVEAVHQDFQKMLNGQTAQVVQTRQELAASGGVAPAAAAAAPGLTEPVKLDRHSTKNGTARAALEKMLLASINGSGGTT
jgi:hypothetical protein